MGNLLAHSSRGAAFGDYDNDGDIDIFVVNRDARAYVLRNLSDGRHRWIAFRATNRHGGTALGAQLRLQVEGKTWIRDVRVAYSYCSSNDPRIYLGLGQAAHVDDVQVTWVDGTVEAFGRFDADQLVEIRRGGGTDR